MIMTETLEEAAGKYATDMGGDFHQGIYNAFKYGAKWQQERSYSDLSIYLQELADKDRLKSLTSNQIRAMIEQFKKK